MADIKINVNQAISDFNSIKNSIVNNGVNVGEGTHTSEYADKVNEVYEAGKKAGHDAFLDNLIDCKISSTGVFSGNYLFAYWSSNMFYPTRDIVPNTVSSMFMSFGRNDTEPTDLKARLEECGVKLDTSKTTGTTSYMFQDSNISHLPVLDFSKTTGLTSTFLRSKVQNIEKVIFNETGTQKMTSGFDYCENLQEIRFEGVIGQDLDIHWSTWLSRESIESILNHLYSFTEAPEATRFLILSQNAVDFAYESSMGAMDGSTTMYWDALATGHAYWTISLM